ncbi:hypothetical protein [Sphaerisporangium sp. TRM90804]|uniref:hypothetical protein n=1 Tax=Sphaerisporangium sp. TRM90804 TaxID=3031113 RepID=UPI00244CF754|nr:hypothetical protein [Sphaerisporangium sp. TRM90804]MDH2429311.1 hypothetical protein [Sphaerisporangium sp. TRM90804]
MPFKTWGHDEVGYAADLNRFWVQGMHVNKTSDQAVTNSTTLVNDSQLLLAVQANTDYWVEAFVIYNAPTANDMQLAWNTPSGATLNWSNNGLALAATGSVDRVSRTALTAASTATIGGSSGDAICAMKGILRTAGSSGSLQMRFAQNTAGAGTNVTVKTGSQIILTRLKV